MVQNPTAAHCCCGARFTLEQDQYSEIPNKSVTFLILFGIFFLPTWPYYLLVPTSLFVFWKISHQHTFIMTYIFINFGENLPPTWLLGPHAY
jgi:hypothetical protein